MANVSEQDDQMDLPPGFRFHPTDEELISHYLFKKVLDSSFCARALGEADLNKSEPWELPWKAKMGEKESYFFCLRDKKYPTGLRTNRATDSGYWKATGKDREIYREKLLVGMKKTLVFYEGRAPKGVKSNWVMHEYRLEGIYSIQNLPITVKKEWVICRVFQKNSGGKKTHISGLVKMGSFENELDPSALPPLMESSPVAESAYVPCFSNLIDHFNNPLLPVSSSSMFPRTNSFCSAQSQSVPLTSNVEFSSSVVMQDQSILALMMQQQERDEDAAAAAASTSAGAMDLDCFWHY